MDVTGIRSVPSFVAEAPSALSEARAAVLDDIARQDIKLAVIDDDPTGTQTVRGVPLITTWDDNAIDWAMAAAVPVLAVLTNSRAMPAGRARALNRTLARRLWSSAQRHGAELRIVSRGDSTLRGHFPIEPEALAEGLGCAGVRTDAILVCPAYPAAGRITVDGVHLVAGGDHLTPVGETEYARDAAFGFRSSRLVDWIRERAGADVAVASISLEDLRAGGNYVAARLIDLCATARYVAADAASDGDLEVLAHGVALAERHGLRLVYRTGPSFIAARAGRAAPPALTDADVAMPHGRGLVVVGSHTRLTTRQLDIARDDHALRVVPLDVEVLLAATPIERVGLTAKVAARLRAALAAGDAALVTSRVARHAADGAASLDSARVVADALVEIVTAVVADTDLQWLIAKGGITSYDMAVRALGARRAIVLGQLFAGQVSVWELGDGSLRPQLRYVVFPGNVGDEMTLTHALDRLKGAR